MTAAPVPLRLALLFVAAAILPGCGGGRLVAPVLPTPESGSPAASHALIWKPIGASVEGRPLLVAQSGSGPLRVYLIGGIHGDETEGRSALGVSNDVPLAAATIRVVRDINPDGTAAYRRTNARGLDLNRNWPATNFAPDSTGGHAPLSEPETRALEQDLRAFSPHVVVVLHSSELGPFVNYDGPAERLASAFAGVAQTVGPGWYVRPEMGYPTPGSLGSYLGVDRNIPVLTVEFQRAQDETQANAALRKGLAAVIRVAAQPSR